MTSKSELTEADKCALSRMPDGWFEPYDLPATIRCPEFRCQRLRDKGMLEWKVAGDSPSNLESRYRKLPCATSGENK